MKYREFGDEIDFQVSALGFGVMRMPTIEKEDSSSDIDQQEAIEMVRYAIDEGLNYLDTAWPYHGGESERLVCKALKDDYRQKVKIATKFSWPWIENELGFEIEEEQDFDAVLNEQLKRLETDRIDLYMPHAVNKKRWKFYRENQFLRWLDKAQSDGRIDYVGFSFHDDLNTFKDIVDAYSWDFCQIMYNYLDQQFQAGKQGLRYAADKGLGIVIMEPLRGGQLATDLPGEVEKIFQKGKADWDPVEWSLHWLWNQPEVSVVLSGMSTMDQVKQNLKIAGRSGVAKLDEEELGIVEKAREKYKKLLAVRCTGCNYCMPCSQGVNITKLFKLYNKAKIYSKTKDYLEDYHNLDQKKQAGNCIECGQCEEVCPQNLPIMDLLGEVAGFFEA